MRILGIDPGISVTGYGIIEVGKKDQRCLSYGGIRSSSKATFSQKLLNINEKLEAVISQFQPDYCAVENVFYHQNKKTAIIMGHARGVAMLAAARQGIFIHEFSPREIKMSIVGFGAASKSQVQAMVQNILRMKTKPSPEDASDALAVALCLHHRLKFQNILQKS